MKLAAYPFQKYGMLDGEVKQVSADAQEKSDSAGNATKPFQEAVYRALIHLNRDYLESQGQRLRFVPGMQVNVEIHLGTRSVLEYLLSPVQKVDELCVIALRRSTLTPYPSSPSPPPLSPALTPAPLPSGEGRLEIPFPRLRGKGMGWGMREGWLEIPFSLWEKGMG